MQFDCLRCRELISEIFAIAGSSSSSISSISSSSIGSRLLLLLLKLQLYGRHHQSIRRAVLILKQHSMTRAVMDRASEPTACQEVNKAVREAAVGRSVGRSVRRSVGLSVGRCRDVT